jgi:hypothetical protein
MSTRYHVQVVVTETTVKDPVIDKYNRTEVGGKEKESTEVVRVGVTKNTAAEALDAAAKLIGTLQGPSDVRVVSDAGAAKGRGSE